MIRGAKRQLAVRPRSANISASIHNRFDVEVVDVRTGEVRQRAQAENIVLDNFWTHWMSTNTNYYNFARVSVGSGTGSLAATRTELFSELGTHILTDKTYTRDDTNHVYVAQGKVVLAETLYVGSTITEIGLGCNNQTTIITHAMLKDMNGNQISIAKTNTDIITIYATLYVHWTSNALNGMTISDNLLKIIAGGVGSSPSQHNAYAITFDNSVVSVETPTITKDTTNKTFSVVFPRIGASVANGHGIKQLSYSRSKTTDDWVETTYPFLWRSNDAVTGEAIGTGNGIATAFSTYFPYAENATVYVNGVVENNVTVTKSSNYTDNIVFDTAPASGAAITADYSTGIIAKDANHVFDFSLVITCGTYAE